MIRFLYIFILLFPGGLLWAQPDSSLIKANYYLNAKEYDNALNININDKNIELTKIKAKAYFYKNDFIKAKELFLKLPSSPEALFFLAKIAARQSNPELAVNYLEQHFALKERFNPNTIKLDSCFALIENSIAWKNFWKTHSFDSEEYLLIQASSHIAKNEIGKLGNLLYGNTFSGRYKYQANYFKALHTYKTGSCKKAIKLFNEIPISTLKDEQIIRFAKILIDCKNPDEAAKYLEKLIKKRPQTLNCYKLYIQALIASQEFKLALQTVNKYLGLTNINNSDLLKLKAEILIKTNNNWDALEVFNHLIENDKAEAKYYFDRGKIFYNVKNHLQAKKDFSMALDLDPFNGETYYYFGLSDQEEGDIKQACYHWQKAAQYKHKKAGKLYYKYCR